VILLILSLWLTLPQRGPFSEPPLSLGFYWPALGSLYSWILIGQFSCSLGLSLYFNYINSYLLILTHLPWKWKQEIPQKYRLMPTIWQCMNRKLDNLLLYCEKEIFYVYGVKCWRSFLDFPYFIINSIYFLNSLYLDEITNICESH
jgi:hypothetical protein